MEVEVEPLDGQIRPYAWGSRIAIAALQGSAAERRAGGGAAVWRPPGRTLYNTREAAGRINGFTWRPPVGGTAKTVIRPQTT